LLKKIDIPFKIVSGFRDDNPEHLQALRLEESIGSGFHKMIEGREQHYGLKPVIEGDFDYYKITFSTTPVKDTARDTVKLSTNQKRIIDEMKKEPRITVDEISNLLDINLRNTKKNMSKNILNIICNCGILQIYVLVTILDKGNEYDEKRKFKKYCYYCPCRPW